MCTASRTEGSSFRAFLLVLGVLISTELRSDDTSATKTPPNQEVLNLIDAALNYAEAGNNDFYQRMLSEAKRLDPDNEFVNSLLGNIKVAGKWIQTDQLQEANKEDAKLAEYESLRSQVGNDAQRLQKLARWCVRHGYKNRASLHYRQLLVHPGASEEMLEDAIGRLDLAVAGGQLVPKVILEAIADRNKRYQDAHRKHFKILLAWQRLIDRTIGEKHDDALAKLQAVDDPDIALVLPELATIAGEKFGFAALKLLAAFEHEEAINAQMVFALRSPVDAVRMEAARRLRDRDTYSFVPKLLDSFMVPVETQWRVVRGEGDTIRYEHTIVRRERDQNVVFTEDNLVKPMAVVSEVDAAGNLIGSNTGSISTRGPGGKTIVGLRSKDEHEFKQQVILAESYKTAAERENKIQAYNRIVLTNNKPIYDALERSTDLRHNRYPQAWWDWWNDYTQNEKTRRPNYTYKPVQMQYEADVLVQHYNEDIEAMGPKVKPKTRHKKAPSPLNLRPSSSGMRLRNVAARSGCRIGSVSPRPGYPNMLAYARPVWIPRDAYNFLPFQINGGRQYPAGRVWRPSSGNELPTGNGFIEFTKVSTAKGLVAINKIQTGDRVITQDPESGKLSFSVVQARIVVGSKNSLRSFQVGEESVAVSKGVSFWVSGENWQISDKIAHGAALHGLKATCVVEDVVEQQPPELLYHLIVEGDHNFFVGKSAVLVHDASDRKAESRGADAIALK